MAVGDPRPEAVTGHPEQALLGTWRLTSRQAQATDGIVTYPLGEQVGDRLVLSSPPITVGGRALVHRVIWERTSCTAQP